MRLAILGGQPTSDKLINYGRQSIDNEDIQAVMEVLKGDYLTTGPTVAQFEQAVADYTGAKYAVAVCNGTAALHAAMFGCGIQEGDEILVTPMTFAASSNSILYMGAKPVFVDIDKNTYNIDVNLLEHHITEKTKAIVPVDFAGQPADLNEIVQIAEKYGLKIIEDGAHSLGSEYRGKRIGSFVDATTFSFHPVKPITTGEGGVITTNDEEIYKRMTRFRTHGITRDRNLLGNKDEGDWYYEQCELGYNYRLTDVQAALGLSQLKKIDTFIRTRREIVDAYNNAFSEIEGIIVPCEKEDRKSGYHIYVVRLDFNKIRATRKEIFQALIAENIGVNVHYIPVYYHPYYRELGYQKGICPVAEQVYEEILTLPLYPSMSKIDILNVIEATKKVIINYQI